MKRKLKNLLRNINYLMKHSLYDEEQNRLPYYTDKIIEDCVYEFEEDQRVFARLDILDYKKTIELLKKKPKSFVRFGDGECRLMLGQNQPFQQYNSALVDKLYAILQKKRDDLYVGVNYSYFHSPVIDPVTGERDWKSWKNYNRTHAYEYRHFYLQNCDPENHFIDAAFTLQFAKDPQYYEELVSLFENKNVVLVSGEGVFEKLQYNVFEKAKSFRIIHGPSKHAFREYDSLISKIKSSVSKDELICVILGMAGKAMVADLTDDGYLVWDIGHMAKNYDFYRKGLEPTRENINAFYAPD